jgi:RimJ/RimL family protein N-acetyltransferase
MDGDGPALHSVVGSDGDMTWDHSVRPVEMVTRTAADRRKHFDSHGFGVWAVIHRDTRQMIGQTGLQQLPDSHDIELVTYTAKHVWRQGYAYEACVASLRYGFESLNASKILAVARKENLGAKHLIAKLGFRHQRFDFLYEAEVEVSLLLRDEWASPSNAAYRVFPFDEAKWIAERESSY